MSNVLYIKKLKQNNLFQSFFSSKFILHSFFVVRVGGGEGHGVGFQPPDGVHGEALLAMFTHDF